MTSTCCDYMFESNSDFDVQAFLDVPTTGRVQVQLNGQITEYTEGGFISLHFQAGFNLLKVIVAGGSIVLSAKLWGSDRTSRWVSLFPGGSDPFLSASQMPGAISSPSGSGPSSPSGAQPSNL